MTPVKPVKRRLSFTTPQRTPAKRGRSAPAVFNSGSKRTVAGPSRRGTLTQQVKSLQRVVSSLAPELKIIEISANVTNLTTAGSIQHLTAIAQGSDVADREGNTINLKQILMQTSFTVGSDAGNGISWRIAIVRDVQQIADTTPAVLDVFSSANPLIAMPNIANRERFKFMWLSPIETGVYVLQGGKTPNYRYTWNGNYKVSYNGTASTDIQKGGLYIIFLTDAVANTMDFVSRVRLTFTDD